MEDLTRYRAAAPGRPLRPGCSWSWCDDGQVSRLSLAMWAEGSRRAGKVPRSFSEFHFNIHAAAEARSARNQPSPTKSMR
jgi:hypothetical protein